MRKITFTLVCIFLLSSCVSHEEIMLKQHENLIVSNHGKPVFSIATPARGNWYIGESAKTTTKIGFAFVGGWLPNSFHGYEIKFELTDAENYESTYKENIPAIKNNVYENILKKRLSWFTPERMKEQMRKNPGGKLISFKGFTCINGWHERTIAPNLNAGAGIQEYNNYIYCPIVVNGVPKDFSIAIRSSINPRYYEQKAEYDRNKRLEDPEINIDTYELMTTLGDKILSIFNDITLYGHVSQNYDDIIDKCDPTKGQKCGIYP